MRSNHRTALPLIAIFICALSNPATADTVLFDFETGSQGWLSFGAVTTDNSAISGTIPGSVGSGYFHSGNFSEPESNFGIVSISPAFGAARDLSAFDGLSVDASFADIPGFPPFVGDRDLRVVVATGFGATEEEFIAPFVTMTESFQTFTLPFSDFSSGLTALPPTTTDLMDVTIKLVVLNFDNEGEGVLTFDQITGVDTIVSPENADFDSDLDVDVADALTLQRGFGVGSTLAEGDANGDGSINTADQVIWGNQFGTGAAVSAPAIAQVPEPGACGLLLGLVAVWRPGRRQVR